VAFVFLLFTEITEPFHWDSQRFFLLNANPQRFLSCLSRRFVAIVFQDFHWDHGAISLRFTESIFIYLTPIRRDFFCVFRIVSWLSCSFFSLRSRSHFTEIHRDFFLLNANPQRFLLCLSRRFVAFVFQDFHWDHGAISLRFTESIFYLLIANPQRFLSCLSRRFVAFVLHISLIVGVYTHYFVSFWGALPFICCLYPLTSDEESQQSRTSPFVVFILHLPSPAAYPHLTYFPRSSLRPRRRNHS